MGLLKMDAFQAVFQWYWYKSGTSPSSNARSGTSPSSNARNYIYIYICDKNDNNENNDNNDNDNSSNNYHNADS